MVHKPEPELEECDCCTGDCSCDDCEACLPPQPFPIKTKPAGSTAK